MGPCCIAPTSQGVSRRPRRGGQKVSEELSFGRDAILCEPRGRPNCLHSLKLILALPHAFSAIPNWAPPPTATVLLSRSHNPSPRCVLLHVHAFKFSSPSFDLVFHASYTALLMESADLSMYVMLQPK